MTTEKVLSSVGTELLQEQDRSYLSKWNAVPPRISNTNIHRLLNQQSHLRPNEPAVHAWDGDLTYLELEDVSTRVAQCLAAIGVAPRTFVPICMEKSHQTVIAILAVIKTGAAFSLLDPSHPKERLGVICRDLAGPVILTDASAFACVDGLADQVVTMEGVMRGLDDETTQAALPSAARPNDPLYAVFTSGSTGSPKGVVVSHAAYATSASGLSGLLCLDSGVRVFQFASYAFDVSISDHLLTLLAGGCICIPSESERKANLAATMERLRVNWTFMTPSMARILEPEDLPHLKYLVLGGEPVLGTDVEKWSPYVRVIGLYGPAEVAAGATVNSDLACSKTSMNIGYAPSVTCWVVDQEDHTKLVPVGAEGELLVEGWPLAQGYLNQTALTESVFVPAPGWLASGRRDAAASRMYKTGDLVRHNTDGSLEYLGRKDSQVKLRGQRIELGEVEAVARGYFKEDCSVIAEVVACGAQEPQLGVFVRFPRASDAEAASGYAGTGMEFCKPPLELRDRLQGLPSYLSTRLPQYMVPTFCILIHAVPLGPTGKLNRKGIREQIQRLPLDEWKTLCSGGQEKLPQRPLVGKEEEIMRHLWAKVLRIPAHDISGGDSWFHIGGNSMSAIQLVSAATEKRLAITLRDVFEHPVLRDLARVAKDLPEPVEAFVPFQWLGNDVQERYDLAGKVMGEYQDGPDVVDDIFPADDMFAICQDIGTTSGYNLTTRVDATLGFDIDAGRLSDAWTAVVQANPVLRSQFVQIAAKGYQVIMKEGIALEIVPGFPKSGIEDVWGLQKPLVRLVLAGNVLSLLIHHAIFDDHALMILFQQLARAYQGESLQEYEYGAYLKWLSSITRDNEGFWKETFAGYRAMESPSTLPQKEQLLVNTWTEPVLVLLNRSGSNFTVTNKATLALALVLARWTGNHDVVFASTNSRRGAPVPAISEMVCPTVMPLPYRVQLKGAKTIAEALASVQSHLLESLPFQNIGWYRLQELSAETAEACKCWTIVNIQAHIPDAIPEMFSDWTHHITEGYTSPHALYVDCEILSQHLKVRLGYDPDVISASLAQGLMESFITIFGLIDRVEDILIQSILDRDCA